MYSVSNAYKTALAKPVHRYRLRGTIRDVSFTEADVLQSSLSITNNCSKDGEVELGGTYAAEMHITFTNDLQIPRYAWVGEAITLEEGLNIGGATYEYVPLGVFFITEANYTSEGIQITAYDQMSALDKPLAFGTTQGTPYEIATQICTDCDITLANEDLDDFPNHASTFYLDEGHGLQTYRDLLGQLAQAICGFATINREGELELRMYGSTEVETIDPEHRMQGGSFSDFITSYNAIRYTNYDGTQQIYTKAEKPTGLMYDAGKNPLLFDRDVEREAVLDRLAEIALVPFSVGLAGTPAYDLGDCLKFTDGLADGEQISCIMKYDYAYNASYIAEGFGRNPALQQVTTQDQRTLQSVAQQTQGKGVVFYPFSNNREQNYVDGGGKTTLLTITFFATELTYVMLEGQAVLQIPEGLEDTASARLTYYIDGEEIYTIHPTWTWSEEGKHTITFMYPVIVSGEMHRFLIMLEAEGSDMSIDAGDIRAVIWGQNMVATPLWDGRIEVEDTVESIALGGRAITLDSVTDTLGAILITAPTEIEIIEDVEYITVGDGITMADITDACVFGKNIKNLTWGQIKETLTWQDLKEDYHW